MTGRSFQFGLPRRRCPLPQVLRTERVDETLRPSVYNWISPRDSRYLMQRGLLVFIGLLRILQVVFNTNQYASSSYDYSTIKVPYLASTSVHGRLPGIHPSSRVTEEAILTERSVNLAEATLDPGPMLLPVSTFTWSLVHAMITSSTGPCLSWLSLDQVSPRRSSWHSCLTDRARVVLLDDTWSVKAPQLPPRNQILPCIAYLIRRHPCQGVYEARQTFRASQRPRMVSFVFAAFLSSVLVLAAKNPKRGLAFADSNSARDLVHANQSNSAITWQYDWAASPSSTLASSGIQYVPMQWGTNGIQNVASSTKGTKILLGFNEPDLASQSNLDPRTAAQLWKQYIQPLKSSGMKLVSPAVTSAPSGIPWLQEFLSACSGCSVDAIAVHWYGSGSQWFIEYLNKVHAAFPSRPIWVTEFADTSTDTNTVADFLKQSTAFMDSQSWVERYAWFAYMREDGSNHYSLLDSSGNLNCLGRLYVTP